MGGFLLFGLVGLCIFWQIEFEDLPTKFNSMAKKVIQSGQATKRVAKPKTTAAAKSKTSAATKSKAAAASDQDNYILGYGSLIEFASRTRTAPDALYVRPVRATGMVRGWFAQARTPGYSPTYVGAVDIRQLKARPLRPYLNGVLYYVTPQELAATDQREDAGYTRVEVLPQNIQMLDGSQAPPQGKIWIYLNKFTNGQKLEDFLPSANYPIVQSYVDICINGCMEIEANFPTAKGFAQDFIESTIYWSEYWVNDRPMPRRPFMYRSNAYTIDQLLAKLIPDYFSLMRIEPASWEGGPQLK